MNARHVSAGGASLTLHVIAAVIITWLPWGDAPLSSGQLTAGPAVVLAQPYGEPGAGTGAPAAADAPAIPGDVETSFDIPSAEPDGATSFQIDYGKIGEHSTSLFPFLTRPLWLERVNRRERGTDAGGGLAISLAPPANDQRRRPALVVGDTAFQKIVDASFSRRNRWAAFAPIASLVERHAPDDPRLAALLRAYVDQNLLQPYVDTTMRDPRLWSMLAVAADNLDFIEFIERHAARSQGSKTATELLFLLDELAQGNLDGLTTLLETDVERDLEWTRRTSPKAYEVIVNARRHYQDLLLRRGMTTPGATRAYYDGIRLTILGAILRSSPGYRLNDARYLTGTIRWRQGRRGEALAEWRAIEPEPTDTYFTAYSDIHGVLSDPADPAFDRVAATRIDGVLAAEHRRWLESSSARLREFGYRVDAF